ncbi:hypothetical protein BBO99_00004298 [Phytophthora kernoviae]|uniref:Uncharacterized protein n=2 Tax=Phytophthora kernoviae TaxID=325452 RepID=A0A3R7GXT8_9STRA|nr:hypothetical protein G195_005056 [Phytophthora kernoviae 00238/432]KAG2525650.1 hypothetical protein JM16_004291 [Phytophthora kernoviae]KAG2527388.1 hypothetical protein JM18_003654 [Phytophthora kernoviae]RLN06661.1 hypothetical protein BBI17_007454 [Phytophthora kernoviae]RLN80722.1 hypothetical protein BBO99_00004298 [Phytophthora kernoviae]
MRLNKPEMDNFLQLVPTESDTGTDPSLVYDDDDLVVGGGVDLETQIQRHIAQSTQGEGIFADQLYRPVEGPSPDVERLQLPVETNGMERQRYLHRILDIEKGMKKADNEVQQRIDTMKRILELKDPMEQLSDRMTCEADSEVALLGAFFFLCDRRRPKTRGMTAMLPVVAAMMEASNGMDHSPF